MQRGPDHLLEKIRAKGLRRGIWSRKIGAASCSLRYSGETLGICGRFRGTTHGSILVGASCGDVVGLELADEIAVVFSSQATEKL